MIYFNPVLETYLQISSEISEAVRETLESGSYILGARCERFEREFRDYLTPGEEIGACVGVNSGTDALSLPLKAVGIRPGDEVITVPNTAVPTAAAITATGAIPHFCDIDRETWQMSPALLEQAINSKTKAVIAVHLFGLTAPIGEIADICKRRGVVLIEDCAQATGVRYRSKHVGRFGDFGAFSFYPTKNLGAFGDGGLIYCPEAALSSRLKALRFYGQSGGFEAVLETGINSRLDEVQAAVLSVKLRYLESWNERRRRLFAEYREKIAHLKIPVLLPKVLEDSSPTPHLFVIALENGSRDSLQKFLVTHSIQTAVHYPQPLYFHAAFRNSPKTVNQTAEDVQKRIMSLPFHPFLKSEQVTEVCERLAEYFKGT